MIKKVLKHFKDLTFILSFITPKSHFSVFILVFFFHYLIYLRNDLRTSNYFETPYFADITLELQYVFLKVEHKSNSPSSTQKRDERVVAIN